MKLRAHRATTAPMTTTALTTMTRILFRRDMTSLPASRAQSRGADRSALGGCGLGGGRSRVRLRIEHRHPLADHVIVGLEPTLLEAAERVLEHGAQALVAVRARPGRAIVALREQVDEV